MRKFAYLLLLLPLVAYAQLTVPQGGTGTTTFPNGWVLIGSTSPLRVTAVSTSSLGLTPTFGTTSISALFPLNWNTLTATLSFLGLSTTSPWTAGQVAYVVNNNTLTSVATGTITCNGTASCGAGSYVIGNALTVTGSPASTIATSGIAVPQLAYFTSTAPTILSSVATTSVSCTGSTTCTSFTAIGASPITINSAAATFGTTSISALYPLVWNTSNAQMSFIGLSTTSPWNTSNLAYVVNGNTLSSVATSTLTASSPLTGSFTQVGTGGSLGCQTASGSQNGCLSSTDWSNFNNKIGSSSLSASAPIRYNSTTGLIDFTGLVTTTQPTSAQVLTSNGAAGVYGSATSTLTPTSPLTGSFTHIGTTGSIGCQTASGSQAGCLASADWTTFNNKISSTSLSANAPIRYNSTTGLIDFTGLVTTTQPVSSNLLESNGSAGVFGVATTTLSATSPISVSNSPVVIGTSASTITCASCNIDGTTWKIVNNALVPTTTLGIIVSASSTIGNGTVGLTVSGTTTVTGNAYFGSSVAIGTTSFPTILSIQGATPAVTMFDATHGQGWQWRSGNLANNSNAFDFFDTNHQATKVSIQSGAGSNGAVVIGTSTPTLGSKVFIFGGSNGANVDAMGDSSIVGGDQATFEAEGSDFGGANISSLAIRYYGPGGLASTAGFANQRLGVLDFGNASTSLIMTGTNQINQANPLIIGTNYTERMRLTGAGFLGIGSSTPWGLLSLSPTTTIGTSPLFTIGSTTNNATSTAFIVNSSNATVQQPFVGIGTSSPFANLALSLNANAGATTSPFGFFIASTSAGFATTTLFAVTNAGNVGIGTSSPKSALAVSGGATIGADYNTAAQANSLAVEGNFSVGMTNPDVPFLLQTTVDAPMVLDQTGGKAGPGWSYFQFREDTSRNGAVGMDASRNFFLGVYNASDTFLEALTVASTSGNVGISTTTPDQLFSVAGVAYFDGGTGIGVRIGTNTNLGLNSKLDVQYKGGGTEYGIVTRPQADTTHVFEVQNAAGTTVGSITETNTATAFNTSSDRRLKENIATTTVGLAVLMQIPIFDFSFKSDPNKTRQQGFVAQDLYKIYPEAVTVGGKSATSSPWGVDYGRITPLIIRAVQQVEQQIVGILNHQSEQDKEIKALQAEVKTLQAQIKK